MPELPEVETVRRTLERAVVGRRVVAVELRRPDVVCDGETMSGAWKGDSVSAVLRHGKQLALVGERGCVACVHLGMSGRLCVYEPPEGETHNAHPPPAPPKGRGVQTFPVHTHVVWRFMDGSALAFTDPRRFGGVWCFTDEAALQEQRWGVLGPDALTITPGRLHAELSKTQRGLKAALLDQHLVAGLGNIYVDELLFATRIAPERCAAAVTREEARRLVGAMRRLLIRAIEAGGSTLRDYVDANGSPGSYALRHKVYGRGGQPCRRCRAVLRSDLIAGRTTVWCGRCQPGAVVTER